MFDHIEEAIRPNGIFIRFFWRLKFGRTSKSSGIDTENFINFHYSCSAKVGQLVLKEELTPSLFILVQSASSIRGTFSKLLLVGGLCVLGVCFIIVHLKVNDHYGALKRDFLKLIKFGISRLTRVVCFQFQRGLLSLRLN